MSNKSHIESGLRKILEIPWIYNTFQTLHGGNKERGLHFSKYFKDENIKKVLDIGCGTGVLLDHLDPSVDYHGCDMEESYLQHAREKYGVRGTFYRERVGEIIHKEWLGSFDAINAHGLIHHLDDKDVTHLFSIAKDYLKPGGFLLTLDPVYYKGQSSWSRWIVSKDRGQNVKTIEAYHNLVAPIFPTIEGRLVKKHNNLGYSAYIMKLIKEG